jgi:hypothetical protein
MAVPLLDSEFMEYWAKLNEGERKSLFIAVKKYVDSKEAKELEPKLRRNLILEEREGYITGKSHSFSWDAVKKMAEDKASRDGL